MTVEQAQKDLIIARRKTKKLRQEIDTLRSFLRDHGIDPDRNNEKLIERNKEIFKLWKNGKSYTDIGKAFNKSGTQIRNICIRIEYGLKTKKHWFADYKELLRYKPLK